MRLSKSDADALLRICRIALEGKRYHRLNRSSETYAMIGTRDIDQEEELIRSMRDKIKAQR